MNTLNQSNSYNNNFIVAPSYNGFKGYPLPKQAGTINSYPSFFKKDLLEYNKNKVCVSWTGNKNYLTDSTNPTFNFTYKFGKD